MKAFDVNTIENKSNSSYESQTWQLCIHLIFCFRLPFIFSNWIKVELKSIVIKLLVPTQIQTNIDWDCIGFQSVHLPPNTCLFHRTHKPISLCVWMSLFHSHNKIQAPNTAVAMEIKQKKKRSIECLAAVLQPSARNCSAHTREFSLYDHIYIMITLFIIPS